MGGRKRTVTQEIIQRRMKAIFEFTPVFSNNPDRVTINNLIKQEDFQKYIKESVLKQLTVTIEPTIIKSEKARMYKYLNGPLIDSVRQAMRQSGDLVDKAAATLEMKCLFAKDTYTARNGDTHAVIMSQKDMTKDRLLEFINDIIMHIESVYGFETPDSEQYKEKFNKLTGK